MKPGKKVRPKSQSLDMHATLQVNSIATKYLEILGGLKSCDHRSVAAFVPKQIFLSSKVADAQGGNRSAAAIRQPAQSFSDTNLDRFDINQSLRDLRRGPSRGVLLKGSTVTTQYQFQRKPTHPFLPLRRKPVLRLYTRMHSAMLLKRPDMRARLKKISHSLIEEPQNPLTPWTFERRETGARRREGVGS